MRLEEDERERAQKGLHRHEVKQKRCLTPEEAREEATRDFMKRSEEESGARSGEDAAERCLRHEMAGRVAWDRKQQK